MKCFRPVRSLSFASAVCLLVNLVACPSADGDPRAIHYKQTSIAGYAPMNAGGTARALMAHAVHDEHLGVHHEQGQQVGDAAPVGEDGHFALALGKAYGSFIIEASRGHYIEPATNRRVNMGDEKIRATLDDVAVQSTVEVALTPWSELLYAYSARHPDKAKVAEARAFLETALGCEDRALTSAAPALPRADAPLQNPSAAEVAYIHLGAWSTLARQVSEQAGLSEGGISSARLVRATAEVIGRKGALDEAIRPADGVTVKNNLLRQPFAQAVRRFLGHKHEHVAIEAGAVMDLLRCTSSAADDVWGAPGEALDEQGPQMALEAPVAETTLMGNANLVCRAHDKSGVARVEARALQDGKNVDGALEVTGVDGLGEIAASLQARIHVGRLSQGKVDFVCEAADTWGNQESTTAALHINHGQASAKLVVDKSAGTVAGVIKLECRCENDYPVDEEACRLTPKSRQEAGLAEMSVGAQSATYSWDTTKSVDGPRWLTCEAHRQGFERPIAHSEEVVVKNHQPIKVIGQVHLDTPVRHTRVMAYAYDGSEKLKKLGETRSEDGSFVLLLSSEHEGAVLFEASEDQDGKPLSTYKSLAVDAEVPVGSRKLRLLWESYQPGEPLPRLYINGLTDLAQAYADALYSLDEDARGDYRLASVMAHRRLGQYVSPQGLDPRTTPGIDLSDKSIPIDQAPVHLALWHVGLSRLAAELGASPYQKSSLDLLEKLRIDLLDGVFNGTSGEAADDVMLSQSGLTRETLRSELSHALHSWLEKRPLGEVQAATNSHFKASDFTRPGQVLHHITANRTALFGGEAGRAFDDMPPMFKVEIRQADETQWAPPPEDGVHGIFYMRATATDDSGVQALSASIDGRPLVPLETSGTPSPKLVSMFRHNTEDDADGASLEVQFTFRDTVGNVGYKVVRLLVDKTPAELTLPPRMVVQDGKVTLRGTSSKPLRHIEVRNAADVVAFDGNAVDEEDGSFALDLQLACDWTHTLSVVATDLAGNKSKPQQVVVTCDALPPVISWEISKFAQQTGGQELVEIGHPEAEPPTLRLQMSALDIAPGADDAGAPSVRFRVEDQSNRNVGSTPGEIAVEYAYEYHGEGPPLRRAWAALPSGAATGSPGEYRLALTYQNLLPQHLQEQPAQAARAANVIGRSSKDDVHRVFVRAKDRAGNVSEPKALNFHLLLSSPTLTVRCAPLVPSIQAARQSEVGSVMATPGVAQFSVSYTWGEPQDTAGPLTPRGALRITTAGADAEWRVVEKFNTFKNGVPHTYTPGTSSERFAQPMATQVAQVTLEGPGYTASSTYTSVIGAPLVTAFWGPEVNQDWYFYWTSFQNPNGTVQGGATKMDVSRAAMTLPAVAAIDGFPPPAAINLDATCGASVAHLAMSDVKRL